MPIWAKFGAILGVPLIAALTVAALKGTRAWHVLGAAVLGEGLGIAILVAWSRYIARQIAEGTRAGAVVSLPPDTPFTQRLPALLLLIALGLAVGGVVLLARRLLPGQSSP